MPDKLAERPRQHLIAAGKLYPGAWRQIDDFRAGRGKEMPGWPDWCFLPIVGYYAIVSGGGGNRVPVERAPDIARLAALGTWRVTQGIYRFDPDLYDSIVSTEFKGDLPAELLHRLPAWCVYIELQKRPGVYGFFAHMESDAKTGEPELRLLIDTEEALLPIPVHIGRWDIVTAMEKTMGVTFQNAASHGIAVPESKPESFAGLAQLIVPLVSLVLYLCTENADYTRPPVPRTKRTKKGVRLFPADKPTTWDVGTRIGAALRRARASAADTDASGGTGTHARPRAHIRRAHWHTFWTGPRDGERKVKVKWLPPIPVNVEDEGELPATVHPVKPPGGTGS